MSSFKKIIAVKPSFNLIEDVSSLNMWKKFKKTESRKEVDSISTMMFNPISGRELYSAASTRLTIYTVPDMEKEKSMSKSADVIYGIDFRSDGKLFALGNSAGSIQVFDSASKKMIRLLKGHKGPVRKVKFSPNKLNIFSISDDKSFKVWDVPTEKEIISIEAHEDYIRACAISQNGKFFITGSYDHKIKIWNTEDYSLVLEIDNGAPVEDLLISPNGSLIISAGSNTIKVWDISCGGQLINSISPHQKTITSLIYNSDCSHIITGGLDRLSKVIDLSSYKVVQSFKFDSPLICVSCNKDDTALFFGLSNGYCVMKSRKPVSITERISMAADGVKFDFVAPRKQVKFTKYEKAFKSFRFKDALDECLAIGNPNLTISCFTELIVYNGLNIALTGRDEMGLLPILKFISKAIQNPQFVSICLEVFNTILDIYGGKVGQSPEIDEYLSIILEKLQREVSVGLDMSRLSGQLEMICASVLRADF